MKNDIMQGPIYKFKSGRVIEIQCTDGRCGYLISHFKTPKEGNWFSLVDKVFPSPIPLSEVGQLLTYKTIPVWLNTHNLLEQKGSYFLKHKCDLDSYVSPKPIVWFGWGRATGTVEIHFPDGRKEVLCPDCALEVFESQMEARGYFMKVFWVPERVGDYLFNGIPLKWSSVTSRPK